MYRLYLLAFCLFSGLAVCAQDDVLHIIHQILDHNVELKNSAALIEADRLDNIDANALENPEVSFARVWGRHGIGNKLQLDVSQSFEWPGIYALRSRAADAGMTTAQLELLSQRLDLALETKLELIDLIYLRKQRTLLSSLHEQMTALSRMVDANREKEMVTVLDQRKISIELYKLENQIAQIDAGEKEIINNLQGKCAGCTLELSGLTEYPVEPLLPAEEYLEQVRNIDPLLAAGRTRLNEQEMQSRVASMQRMPGFSIGYQHQAEMGDRFNGFTVGMSLPFFQNRKAKAAAMERRNAAALNIDMVSAEKEAQVLNTLQQTEIWRSRTEGYNRVFGDNKYPVLLHKAYEGGELSVLEYISEIQYYTDATLTCLETDYKYRRALAALNKYSLID